MPLKKKVPFEKSCCQHFSCCFFFALFSVSKMNQFFFLFFPKRLFFLCVFSHSKRILSDICSQVEATQRRMKNVKSRIRDVEQTIPKIVGKLKQHFWILFKTLWTIFVFDFRHLPSFEPRQFFTTFKHANNKEQLY